MSLSPLNRSTLKVSALCTKWLILLRHWNGWTVQTSAWLAGQNQCDCRIKHANKQQRVNVRDERAVYIYIYVCVCVSMVEPVKRLYRLQCRGGNYVASLDSNQAIFPFIKRQNLSLSLSHHHQNCHTQTASQTSVLIIAWFSMQNQPN